MPSTNDILGVILGAGRGTRLYPLTRDRAKPAVPIAGKYRLIDVPISNCINAGINRIAILTQFNSVSLHRHISRTYVFDAFRRGFVQVLAAEQTPRSDAWYQGTADAVRKQLFEIQATGAEYVLVLAGDHLYRMDYNALAEFHWSNQADITVAVQPVPREEAPRFGLLKRMPDGRIADFVEKPKDPQVEAHFISRDDPQRPFLGSMGIYMFKTQSGPFMRSIWPSPGQILPSLYTTPSGRFIRARASCLAPVLKALPLRTSSWRMAATSNALISATRSSACAARSLTAYTSPPVF